MPISDNSLLTTNTFDVTPDLIGQSISVSLSVAGPIPVADKSVRLVATSQTNVYFVATVTSVNTTLNTFAADVTYVNTTNETTTSYSSWYILEEVQQLTPAVVPNFATTLTDAELNLSVEIPLIFQQNLVMAKSAKFDTEDYVIVEGYPVAIDGNGAYVQVSATVSNTPVVVNDFSPKYYEVDLGSDSRWVADAEFYPDGIAWSAFEGTYKQTLVAGSAGDAPVVLDDYTTLRSDYTFESTVMSVSDGQYLYNPGNPMANLYYGILLVVTLNSPDNDSGWYGIVSTGNYLGSNTDEDANLSLRYYDNGTVEFHYKDTQSTIALKHGMSNPYRPIVVGFDVDLTTNVARFITFDGKGACINKINIDSDLAASSDIFVGASPSRNETGFADMAIYEVNQYITKRTEDEILDQLEKLDSIYGVTVK